MSSILSPIVGGLHDHGRELLGLMLLHGEPDHRLAKINSHNVIKPRDRKLKLTLVVLVELPFWEGSGRAELDQR